MSERKKDFSTEQEAVTIPFFVHENEMVRLERLNKRWFIAFLIAIVMLFVTNAGWIVYESQFETYYYAQEATTENAPAIALLNTGEGDVIYNGNDGEASTQNSGEENQQQQSDQNMPQM